MVGENHTAVLRTDVVALAVERGWVVQHEEYFEQGFVADEVRVKQDVDDFGQSGVARADRFVIGVGILGARVAAFDIKHAFEFGKGRFEAPKASSGECGQFESFGGGLCNRCGTRHDVVFLLNFFCIDGVKKCGLNFPRILRELWIFVLFYSGWCGVFIRIFGF